MKLSIVIPAHNEEQRLPPVLAAYEEFFRDRFGDEVELIVVVNGSTDNTYAVIQQFAKNHPIVSVINEPRRVGKGGAVMLGLQQATGELMGFVDADGSTAPEAFFDLVAQIGDAGCIIASRWLKGSIVEPKQPLSRRVASRIFNSMVNVLFGFRVHDTQCGAKLFQKEVVEKILPDLGITRWAFDVDMLFCVRRQGYAIKEIPTVWRDAAGSKVQVVRASAEMAVAMIRLRLIYSPFRWVVDLYNKWIRPARRVWTKVKADDLLFHSIILFVSMMTVHVCNILFQMVVGRVLPEAEYALLAAFLGVLTIIQRPLSTLSTAVCHYGSLLEQEGRRGDVKRLLRKWLLLTAIPSILAGMGAILFADTLAGYFHLERTAPVIIAGFLLPALCWLPILNGAAQGLQMFVWTSSSAFFGALGRLFLGAGFTMILYDACGWAMLGHGLGIYVNLGLLFIGLWLALHGRKTSPEPLPSMRLYLFQSFFVLVAYAVLLTADVVLVKHFLPDDMEFAKAATVGRMVVFLPSAIVVAMFPKVASKGTLNHRQQMLFMKSFGCTAAFVAVSVLGCYLLPGLLARIMFGIADASTYLKLMIGAMSVMMAFNALLNVVVQFLLAQRRFMACIPIVVCAGLYLAGVRVFHANTWQVIAVAGICNLGALMAGVVGVAKVKVQD